MVYRMIIRVNTLKIVQVEITQGMDLHWAVRRTHVSRHDRPHVRPTMHCMTSCSPPGAVSSVPTNAF